MKDRVVRTRDAANASRNRASRPAVEALEGRLLLYAYTGDHFAHGNLITWSIMPDGTNLGGVSSNLVATLNARLGAGVWEQAIADAFAQWEDYGNINVAQVGDDGEPFNAGLLQQGSPSFGDIRIGGFAQASNVLAFTMLPPLANGGSDSGDMFFNTSQPWNIGSAYDLETVAVHEIGHAVAGLGESSDPNAAEYEYYSGTRQALGQDDINGIQAVWGPRAEDPIAQAVANFTSANAYDITWAINHFDNQIYFTGLDVASSSESYWYKVTTPSNAFTNLWVQLQSTGLSELSPKVQIYNSALQGLTQVAAPLTSYGATLYAEVGGVLPGQTYYIHVSGSSALANGTGAYAMAVDMGPWALTPASPPVTAMLALPDLGGGGLFEKTPGADLSNAFTPKTSNTPSTPETPKVDVSELFPLGTIRAQGDFHLSPSKTAAYRPTHLNIPHPVAPHQRKLPVPQDGPAKVGKD